MKILLHSHFPTGHAYPMQAVATALVDRGHEVTWLTSAEHRSRAEAAGAKFVPTKYTAEVDAPLSVRNVTGLFDDLGTHLQSRLLAQVADYRSVLANFPADVLLVDVFPCGAQALYELGGIPVYATLGVIPLYTSSAASPLPRSGICPPLSWTGLLENALRQLLDRWVVLPLGLGKATNDQRKLLRLPMLPYGRHREQFSHSPDLHIQASSPTLEFRQLPSAAQEHQNVAFVGNLCMTSKVATSGLPTWWEEVVSHPCVVGLTQGTLATDPSSLILPAVEALSARKDVLIVIVSAHACEIEAATKYEDNVRVATWLPYHMLLPRLSLLVTNGGYGSITSALSYGVPLLCAGQSEDKIDTAARVAWSGSGLDLKTDRPTATQIRAAADTILGNDKFRVQAGRIGREMTALGGAERACILLEKLVQRSQLQSQK